MTAAARIGDLTIHGGTIVAGAATVSINGRPAARQGDLHVCPMCNPGSPPPPHVGGPITGGASTVSIEQRPAARVGDACACSGPPDAIAAGEPTVQIGDGGDRVQIGGTGGTTQVGGRGMTRIGGGQASAPETAPDRDGPIGRSIRSGAAAPVRAPLNSNRPPAPFLQVSICDAAGAPRAGAPVSLQPVSSAPASGEPAARSGEALRLLPGDGCLRRAPFPATEDHRVQFPQVFGAEWSAGRVQVGDTVWIRASASGIDDGTPLPVRVLQVSRASGDLTTVYETETPVTDGRIDLPWTSEFDRTSATGHPEGGGDNAIASEAFVAEVGGLGPGKPARTRRLLCDAS